MARLRILSALSLTLLAALWLTAAADETSAGDKLRILYSNRFTFTDDGLPLLTIELVNSRERIHLTSQGGVTVRPDGEGGSEIVGGREWTISVEDSKPAVMREWVVVESLTAGDHAGLRDALTRWRERGYEPRAFEVGTVFGVEGEVIDAREQLVAVAPQKPGRGASRARTIAKKYGLTVRVHRELTRRPSGLIVARSGDIEVRNPSVIWFAPRSSNHTLSIDGVPSGAGGSQLDVTRERRRYFGRIYVTLDQSGELSAVNAVAADKLLAGLVPAEIFPSAADDALAAQAIAARTELLQKIGTRHLTDPFLLCATQHCQVYAGAGKEHPRTTRAVEKTRGQVLLRASGGLVDARYSAACGGHSEHNDYIWGGQPDPALRGAVDAAADSALGERFKNGVNEHNLAAFLSQPSDSGGYCGATRFGKNRFRWHKRVSAAELSRRVADKYPRVGRVQALEPLKRGVSGRIGALRIRGDRGQVVARGDLHLRRLLGGLRSSLFTVVPVTKGDTVEAFEFRGAGFGHGVGMCQVGAIGMAESGIPFDSILKHYYPGSRVKRFY